VNTAFLLIRVPPNRSKAAIPPHGFLETGIAALFSMSEGAAGSEAVYTSLTYPLPPGAMEDIK
jgi:hypothetical protein